MLFALSWVISENKLTTPKSTMNVIAADIRLFFSLIFQTNYLSHFIHHSTLNIQHWRKSTLISFITQHSSFNIEFIHHSTFNILLFVSLRL